MMQEDEVIYDAVEEAQIIEDVIEEVVNVEIFEAFQAPTTSDAFNHALLNNREIHDAHPITAITGLREELDEIESLKTVYSDAYNVANYYKWKDAAYDEYGYFVSIIPGTSEIEVCGGSNIFGVSVETAGFVGGENADVPRDNTYGLIATSGLVDVRCELEVNVGDCVVSNAYGYAKKADTNYGYKVLTRENKGGVEYAVIALGVQADVTNELGIELAGIQEQVDANYKNIISAVNVANQAYNKAAEIEVSNQVMSGKVNEAVGKVNGVVADVEDLTTQVSSSALVATQAKAIAESAATSAEAMKNEAVEKAKEALDDTSKLRREFNDMAIDVETKFYNAALELDGAKKLLDDAKIELQGGIDGAVGRLEDLEEDLEPLATWPKDATGDDIKGIAGFVARADDDSAILASMVTWKGDAGESLAGFVQEATENNATVSALANYTRKDADGNTVEPGGAAGLIAQVDANQAVVQTVAALDGGIAGLAAKVTNNESSLSLLASQTIGDYITVDAWSETNKYTSKIYYAKDEKKYYYYKANQWIGTTDISEAGLDGAIAGVKSTADANKAQLDALASYQAKDEDDEPIYSVAGIIAHVDKNSAEVSQLATYSFTDDDGNPVDGAAGLIAQVDKNKSEISAIATYTFTKNDKTTVTGLAGLNAYVNENESNVALVADRIAGDYVVLEDAWNTSGKDTDKVYYVKATTEDTKDLWYYYENEWNSTEDPYVAGLPRAMAGIQAKTDDNSASIDSLVSWQGNTNTAIARIEQKADANGAYIQSTVSNMDKYSVGPHSQAYGFTLDQAGSILEEGMIYVPTESVTEEYSYTDADGKSQTYNRTFTPQYLYKWGKVNGQYRWITVDKNYTETTETNTSSKAVYFSTAVPTVSGNFGYWYTNGNSVADTYKPYTLYKWESYVDENDITQYHWVAVATLARNSQNRAVSQIRQDANSIELRVTNTEGDYAGLRADLNDTNSTAQIVASWKSSVESDVSNIASIKSTADSASASISQVVRAVGSNGEVNAASIVQAVNSAGSSVTINADHIKFDGFVSFANTKDVEDVKNSAIYDTRVEYALSTSATTFTAVSGDDGKWSTVAPEWRSGAYMWQRTTIVKGDGSTDGSSEPTCIQGARGQDGTIDPNAKQVNTHTRTQPLTWWQEHADPECTDKNWTINAGQGYSNTHLTVGDLAYIVGVATKNDDNIAVIICGTVVEVVEPSGSTSGKVAMNPSHLIVGGQNGHTPVKGVDYFDGTNGSDGTSIVWKGAFTSAPTSPQNGWAYYNSTAKASYVYQGGAWYQMSIDGVDGQNGSDGVSIVWKGELSSSPASPQINWVYKDTDDGKVYIYNGTGWELMVLDGTDGADGADGTDGLSVFITYNDNTTTPNAPTGDGTSNGWHTNATYNSIWMSQKVAAGAGDGTWGSPIKIKGENGIDGTDAPRVMSEEKQFHTSTSNTNAPDSNSSGWAAAPTNYEKGKFLWARSVYTMDKGDPIKGAAYLDKNFTTIANWCKDNNEAYIDGAKIYAGSVTAEQIDTEGLQAEYIQSKNYYPGSSYESLVFTKLTDGVSYKVGLKQDFVLRTVVIPSYYNGSPIIEIDGDSFEAGKDIIETLSIPSTITKVPFGFLEGYSVLEEIHMPIVEDVGSSSDTWFAAIFGDSDSDTNPRNIPSTLKKVFVFSSTNVPSYYFANMPSLSIFLADTVTRLANYSFSGYAKIYYCGNKENLTVNTHSGVKKENIEEVDEYISMMTESGFRISSKEGELMINSGGFKVTHDGKVIAKVGNIAGWEITEGALYKNTNGISSGMCSIGFYDNASSSDDNTNKNKSPSVGLEYAINSDGYTCSITGIGDCVDTDICIGNKIDGYTVTTIDYAAFRDCAHLTSVTILDGVTSIGVSAFSGCTGLTSITIPDSVTSIGGGAFGHCSSITSIAIPYGVTSIGDYTFQYCGSLTSIVIPNSVTSIGVFAFYNCSSLTSITIPDSVTSIGARVFIGCNDALTIRCVCEQIDTSGWSNLWNAKVSDGSKKFTTIYGYIPNGIESLVEDCYSLPRFFAGSKMNIPTFADDAKFLVLEDGSLYARAVNIRGTGKIGGYTLSNDILTSGSGDKTVTLDGSDDGVYAITAGSDVARLAPFSVTKEGIISASGGSFSGNIIAADCKIGPISFDNRGFNISKVTIRLHDFTESGFKRTLNVYDENRISYRDGQMNYNHYNLTNWTTQKATFTTGGSYPTGPVGVGVQMRTLAKIAYTKPHIAWTFDEIQAKGTNVASLLASGDWEKVNISDNPDIYFNPGSAIMYLNENEEMICMHHFPLMKDCFGATSENLITATSTDASISCGGAGINSNNPGFYLGTNGLKITGGETSGHFDGYVQITVDNGIGKIWCDKLFVINPSTGAYIDVGDKLKDLK